jgi:hypothetical protein
MTLVLIAVASAVLAAASTIVMTNRRADRLGPDPERPSPGPIVIQLPPNARMRLRREAGLSYALEVDDTVRITGINVSQVARVAASFVDAHARSGGRDRDPAS